MSIVACGRRQDTNVEAATDENNKNKYKLILSKSEAALWHRITRHGKNKCHQSELHLVAVCSHTGGYCKRLAGHSAGWCAGAGGSQDSPGGSSPNLSRWAALLASYST